MMELTFGRYPTYEETIEYYTRNDVLEFINDAAAVRKVVFTFRDEPSVNNEGDSPPLESPGIDGLREHLIEKFAGALPEKIYPREIPLQAYPSFHFLTKTAKGQPWDFIMEADCPGWRRSFVDVRGAVEFLHEYHVPFIVKFSGHRSLHLIIPREAFPEKFRGRPIGEVWSKLEKELRVFLSRYGLTRHAHGTGGILRLPYSLNENTGMVSLPIPYEELDSFRPWESFHHLVSVGEKLSSFIRECEEESSNTAAFLDAALDGNSMRSLSRRMWSFSLVKKPEYAELTTTESAGKAESAWRDLAMGIKPDDEVVKNYRNEEDPDVRWFIAESLIGDERSFDLLPEGDEYALCAIEDSIAQQASASIHRFFDDLQNPGDYHSIRGLQAILERLDPEAMNQELLRRSEVLGESELRQLIRFASIASSVLGEWDISEKVTQRVLLRFPGLLDGIEQEILAALKGLEARNIDEIRKAQRVLMEAGKKATESLLLAMTSDRFWVRRRVIEVVLKLKDPVFMDCLVNALGDGSRKVRSTAMSALIDFGEAAKAPLQEAANSDNPILSSNAIRALGYIQGEDSLGIVISALENANVKVKTAAVKTLIKIRDSRALGALRAALWDVSSSIGVKAAYGLVSFGAEGQKILKDAFTQAEAEGAAQAARCIAHGLVKAGDETGLAHVAEALYDESWKEWDTPLIIARLNCQRGNDILVNFIRRAVENSEMTFTAQPALTALGEIRDERAIPLLLEFLRDRTDKRTLKSGVNVLRSRGKEAAPALIQMTQWDNYSLAQRAASALVKIGQDVMPEVQQALAGLERDSKPWKLLNSVLSRIIAEKN